MCGRSDTKSAVDRPSAFMQHGNRPDRFEGRPALVLDDDGLGRHAALDRERTADGGLRRPVARGLAPGDQQPGRIPGEEERHAVIETGGEHRRWPTVVLGRPHDHDRVGRSLLVALALGPDPVRGVAGGQGQPEAGSAEQPEQVASHGPGGRRRGRRSAGRRVPGGFAQRP